MGSGFRTTKIILDICMTISLLLLMPYSLLSETAHEWIGITIFTLFVVHHILNRKWLATMTKGKYTPFRVVQTLLVIVMLILMGGSMVSGILLSNHIFKAVNIAGISMEARQVHIFCAYWGFVVMSIHLGMHWNMVINMTGRLFKNSFIGTNRVVRLVDFLLAGYGMYAFYKRQIGEYLLMKTHFVFYDYTENVMFFILDYFAVMILIAFVTYYISKLLKVKKVNELRSD